MVRGAPTSLHGLPNEASLLCLATGVLMEIDDDWQTENRYLSKTTT